VSPPRAILSWSSGKDCAFALLEARRLGLADVVGVLTTVNEAFDRVAMHGTRKSLLDAQVAALGLPMIEVRLPWPCPNDAYEARMGQALSGMADAGIRHIVFGDLFLADVRAYREAQLAASGLEAIFPLWGRDTTKLSRQIVDAGIEAHLVAVDPRALDPAFAGRRYDATLLADLPPGIDPCGENGEFHTAVTAGPMFSFSIPVKTGETLSRDGFVFTDLLPD
jgi:uncharacterized protein (TIGR00290 family)